MSLRWILLIAGLVLIAAIYFMDRRNRRTQPSDRQSARPVADGSQHTRGYGPVAASDVPELDDSIAVRARIAERPLSITSTGSAFDTADLPPMHASAAPTHSGTAHYGEPLLPSSTIESPSGSPRESQLSELSTGSFIALQAQRRSEVQPQRENSDEPVARMVASEATLAPSTPAPASRPTPKKSVTGRKIIALRLAAGSNRVEGAHLKSLLESAGLRHGKYSIYHRMGPDEKPIFSVASMVEPGTFDPFAMSGVQFPGVTIFMQLPGPIPGGEMVAQMLACARELEQRIGGLLQDERGLPLTEQRAQRLHDDVADFMHLLGPQ